MEQYILAIDAGTTSARCILFDRAGQMCAVAQKELHLNYPHDGWVEQDYLPAELVGRRFYQPRDMGDEARLSQWWRKIHKIRKTEES